MSRYKRTRLILPPKGRPLDRADLILREVNREEAREQSFTPQPPLKNDYRASQLKPSVGLFNFYRNIIKFSLEFRP